VIDFRYHLVSIVAVFLALAVGIVLGTTALNGPLTQVLRTTEATLRQTAANLRTQNGNLANQVSADQQFGKAVASLALPHLLDGQSVALVVAPGANQAMVSGIAAAVQQAGGTVTVQLDLQQQFFDTSAATEHNLATLAQQLAPPGTIVTGQGAPQAAGTQLTGQLEAARVIADAIVTKDGPALPPAQIRGILAGFAHGGYLQVSKPVLTPATLAVVIIPATPPAAGASDPANVALISLTQKLNGASRGAVLAGPVGGSGPGSAIDELASGNTGIEVSSVDSADTEIGQIEVVQALSRLLAGHQPASYGIAPGTAPSPAPTPSASLSPSSVARPARHHATARHTVSGTPGPSASASKSAGRVAAR
jgi:hypothetical protein